MRLHREAMLEFVAEIVSRRLAPGDALPREPTGKLLKRKLRDPYWEGRERAI